MSVVINTTLPKICHRKVGDLLRLPDMDSGEILPEVFMVVAIEEPKRRAARPNRSEGLYDDERTLLLVSMTTGTARPFPNKSSRAQPLTCEEVAAVMTPELAKAPVLVPVATEKWTRLQLKTPGGRIVVRDLNLADADDVTDALEFIKKLGAAIFHSSPLEQEDC